MMGKQKLNKRDQNEAYEYCNGKYGKEQESRVDKNQKVINNDCTSLYFTKSDIKMRKFDDHSFKDHNKKIQRVINQPEKYYDSYQYENKGNFGDMKCKENLKIRSLICNDKNREMGTNFNSTIMNSDRVDGNGLTHNFEIQPEIQSKNDLTGGKLTQNYLPPISMESSKNFIYHHYTLIIDLEGTLTNSFQTNNFINNYLQKKVMIRPYCTTFLERMSRLFEIVIFSDLPKFESDLIIEKIDPSKRYIKHRLYERHLEFKNGQKVKNLARLGRDLSKTIIVDHQAFSFALQPENGIILKTWTGNRDDYALQELAPLLEGNFNPFFNFISKFIHPS